MALVTKVHTGRMCEEADVVVVGGGPGGSTLAMLVAMRGHRVVLLEKGNSRASRSASRCCHPPCRSSSLRSSRA
ncbi:MAG: FAD-dependent oxidoreductase [Streptosporangiaceae bacterium]